MMPGFVARGTLVLLAFVAGAPSAPDAGKGQPLVTAADVLFDQLKTLAGDWQGTFEWTGARTDKGVMRASYYVAGNGSAVVENLTSGAAPEMTTVYHRDGADLRMTHYCAAQNQPRLKAAHLDAKTSTIKFAFIDVTNLAHAAAGHVTAFEIQMVEANKIRLVFTFKAGEKLSYERIELTRTSAATK